MAIQLLKLTCKTLAICALGVGLMPSIASAAGNKTNADIQAQYRADVAHCKSPQANQDRTTCMKEAGAAMEEAKRDRLVVGNANYQENQANRCKALPTGLQQDCLMQMSGQDTVTKGSVSSGGILRETTITVPAKQ
ncbi:MAG: hypothetical protein ABI155_04260 [Paralcaligenes sp.]